MERYLRREMTELQRAPRLSGSGHGLPTARWEWHPTEAPRPGQRVKPLALPPQQDCCLRRAVTVPVLVLRGRWWRPALAEGFRFGRMAALASVTHFEQGREAVRQERCQLEPTTSLQPAPRLEERLLIRPEKLAEQPASLQRGRLLQRSRPALQDQPKLAREQL